VSTVYTGGGLGGDSEVSSEFIEGFGSPASAMDLPPHHPKTLYAFLALMGGGGYVFYDSADNQTVRIVTELTFELGRTYEFRSLRRLPSLGKRGGFHLTP
jgi:hypothetical protein